MVDFETLATFQPQRRVEEATASPKGQHSVVCPRDIE